VDPRVVIEMGGLRWMPLIVLVLLPLGGCGGRANPETWRQHVTAYTREHAHGDLNVLSRMRTVDGRRGFTVLGADDPERSTDVVGLLLGHRVIGDRPWFVYLVGTVERGELTEAHPAAAHWNGDEFVWVVGDAQPDALETYRAHLKERKQVWRADEEAFDGSFVGWPREADSYELTVGPGELTIRETRSGARWALPLNELKDRG